jgi:N-carbamoylputrescine amidase
LGVGSRVELLYDNPIKFFAGTISRFNRGTGKGTIVFDDGEINEVDLRDSFWKYRILKKDNRLLLLPNSGGKNKAPKLVVTKNTGNQAKNEVSRSRFDPAGFQRLENEFKQTPNPSMSRREELAREFNVPTQVVSNWFGRKRHEMKGKGIVSASTSGSRPLPSSSDPHRKNDREAAKGALITFGKENSKDTFDNVLMAVDKVVGKLVGARGEESLRASMRRRNKFTKKRRKTEATEERGRDRPAKVCVAAIQMSCTGSYVNNLSKAISEVYKAKKEGAHIVLLQELFTESYFPQVLDDSYFDKAVEYESSQLLAKMSEIAKDLEIVIPVSFFEVCNNAYFNSVCVIDADGERRGLYRKAHIPHSPGYEEKFYFSPGNTDFQVFETRYAKIGIGICWDQWYPEVARILALKGAELLLYPTAIGSEPQDSKLDSRMHWMRVMQGHAGANFLPIVASNRIGSETFKHYNDAVTKIDFYGHSFICGPTGEVVACAEREDRKVIVATFDLKEIQKQRRSWGLFRDRRPDLYEPLLTLDGHL